jgi:ribokinase
MRPTVVVVGSLNMDFAVKTKHLPAAGETVFGSDFRAGAGVDVSAVHASRSHRTAVAMIAVEEAGQNSIVVASGANADLAAADVAAMRRVFRGAAIAMFQLETPLAPVAAALNCRAS